MRRLSGRRAIILFALVVAICYGQVVWWFIFQLQRSHEVERLQLELLAVRPGGAGAAAEAQAAALRGATHHRTRMFVAEGSFFLAAITIGLAFIARAYRHERALKRRQDDLLGAVSHEFNTPLQSLRLSLETMSSRELPPDRRERYLRRMTDDVDRLATMVDELLHIQRLQGAAPAAPAARFDLGEAVESALMRLRPRLQAAEFTVEVASGGPAPVSGRLADLSYAVELLLDNAVKYAAQGKWARVSCGAAPGGLVTLSAADRGPGLTAEDRLICFERFGRGTAARQGTIPGTGLGLAIVRRIVADHRGTIVACDEPAAGGACFRITLPAAAGGEAGA